MGTVTSLPYSATTALSNQRKVDRCQNGVLWSVLPSEQDQGARTLYSTDNSSTWTQPGVVGNGSASSSTTYQPNGSLFIDIDDYAHWVCKDNSNGFIYYRRGTPNAARTAYTWSAATVVENAQATFDYPDLIVHREGTGWAAHVVYTTTENAASKCFYRKIAITSGGALTVDASRQSLGAGLATANANPGFPSIDFNHTGDGKTVAGGTPHLYVGWSAGGQGAGYGIRFRKATYSAGSWTWGTEREIDNTRFINSTATWLTCAFDGTRVVLVGYLRLGSNNTEDLNIYDRDAADPGTGGTTARTFLAASGVLATAMYLGSATYDSLGNIYAFGRGNASAPGSNPFGYMKWDRAAGSLGSRVTVDATANDTPYGSVRRGPQGQAIDYVWTDGTASPYSVMSGRITLNQNPTAATPLTPADNATIDSSTDQTVTFRHNDPDGDQSSSWRVRYRPAGTSVAYQYLTGTAVVNNGANITASVAAGLWNGQVEYASQTYDPSGAEGAWSATRTATGIPAALAALTGGQGGTSLSAQRLYNVAQSERGLRALSLV